MAAATVYMLTYSPLASAFGVCSISGLPAKYKDPVTGLGYANVAAFKELRRLHAGQVRARAQWE